MCANIDVNWTVRMSNISVSSAERDLRLRCQNLLKQSVFIEDSEMHLAVYSSAKCNKAPVVLLEGFPCNIKQKFKKE